MDNNPIWLNDELGDEANGGGDKGKQPTYTVHSGDNLTKIAKKYNTTVEQIVKWNNIPDPNKIKVGQVIKVGPKPTQNSKPKTNSNNQNNKSESYNDKSITLKGQNVVASVQTKKGGVQLSSTSTIRKGSSNITTTLDVKTGKVASTSVKLGQAKLSISASGDITCGNDYYQVGTSKNGLYILNVNIPTNIDGNSTYNMKFTIDTEVFERLGNIIKQDVDFIFKSLDNSNSNGTLAPPPFFYYAIP